MEQLFPIIQNGVAKNKNTLPRKPFIEANSMEVSIHHLEQSCIIPFFAMGNVRTISHQEKDNLLDNLTKNNNNSILECFSISFWLTYSKSEFMFLIEFEVRTKTLKILKNAT